MPKLAEIISCTGCGACIDACPKGALKLCTNEEGHFFYSLQKELCIDCHKCEKVCPVVSFVCEYGTNSLSLSKPYAAWSTNSVIRRKSTSGGVFAAIAHKVLKEGGVVVGAALQDNRVRHIAIDDISSLEKLQGSKYAQSNTCGIYKEVYEYLKQGKKVLFSGTACQIAALYAFLPKSFNTEFLTTMDLVCGGVPSNFLIERYLAENNNTVKNIVGFREKESYEFSVIDNQGNIRVIPLSERPLPLCGFYWEMTNRFCCYDCHYAYTHRKADLTIGDLWGDKRFVGQHKEGLSLVIVHSRQGEKVFEESDIEKHILEWKDVLPYNPRIAYGKNLLVKTRERKRLSVAFKEYSFQRLLDDYANDASFKRPWSVIKKIYRVILITINHKIAVSQIKRILKG